MLNFPILTERLKIDLFTLNDITEQYISWLNDGVSMKYSNQRFKHHSLESCVEYLNSFNETTNQFLAIRLNHNNFLIGTMTIYADLHNKVADLGILIGNTDYKGKGFGLEAWKYILNELLMASSIRKVTGGTVSCNYPMLKIMKNSGMVSDGVKKSHALIDDQEVDILYFAKFKSNAK